MAKGFDVDELVKSVREEQQRRIDAQADAVRALGLAANKHEKLREQLAAAESEWATAYQDAVSSGLDERVIAKLKPPTGARPARAAGRRAKPVADAAPAFGG